MLSFSRLCPSTLSKSAVPSASAVAVVVRRRATGARGGASYSPSANDADDGNSATPGAGGRGEHPRIPAPPGDTAPPQRPRQQTRRRTRRRNSPSSPAKDGSSPIPSLAEFMYRAKVLKQYRHFVRLARFVDDGDKSKTALGEVRLSYRTMMKKGMDDVAKNMAFAEGERRLRETEGMVGYSPSDKSSDFNLHSFDEDSWINIKDGEDPRGRVGVQWPWDKG